MLGTGLRGCAEQSRASEAEKPGLSDIAITKEKLSQQAFINCLPSYKTRRKTVV